MQSSRRKKTDWHEFYRHGVPKEVIVIEDSPDAQATDGAPQFNNNVGEPELTQKKQQTSYPAA